MFGAEPGLRMRMRMYSQLMGGQLRSHLRAAYDAMLCLAWAAVELKPSIAAELAEADAAGVILGQLTKLHISVPEAAVVTITVSCCRAGRHAAYAPHA